MFSDGFYPIFVEYTVFCIIDGDGDGDNNDIRQISRKKHERTNPNTYRLKLHRYGVLCNG